MINKSLVKKRFEKSLETYDDNAIVQKLMAEELIKILPLKNYDNILEIGTATGILTKEIKKNIKFKTFYANDIVESSKEYIKKIIPEVNFITGDIEEIKLSGSYDLIISNACFQWCSDINILISKLKEHLNDNSILALSMFGDDNLKEIKAVFNMKNTFNLPDVVKYKEDKIKLYFDTPKDVLRHLKLTGANALKEFKFTKSRLLKFEEEYKHMFSENGKVYLTYNPVYFLISKNGIE